MNRIYLDNAATTAVAPAVLEAMLPYFTEVYGNPSSIHATGREAHKAVDAARRQVAAAINAQPSEIYFTAGVRERQLGHQGHGLRPEKQGQPHHHHRH